jgi:hypothetical protein
VNTSDEYMDEEHSDEYMDDTTKHEYMDEEHSDEYMDDTTKHEYMDEEHSDEYMDDTTPISIHEQSECYTCKQYECNEYVRSALARSNNTIEERSDDIIKPKAKPTFKQKIVRCSKKAKPKAIHFLSRTKKGSYFLDKQVYFIPK